MDLTIFAMLFEGIGPPIIEAVDAVVAALQGWMRPILVSGVTLYVVGKMVWATLRGEVNPLGDSLAMMVSGSVIIYAATEAAGLGPQARNLLLNGISNEVGRLVLGAVGNRQLGADLFDDALARAWAAGLDVYNKLPTFSLKAWALAVLVVFYWIFAFGCVAVAFFIWLTAFVMVALLVGLWPLGVGLFAFPWTRFLAWGWLRSAIANVLLQILLIVVLAIVLGAIRRILGAVAATLQNEITNVGRLLLSGIVFGLLAWVAKQLPGLAATWAHGFTGFGQTAFIRVYGSLGGSGSPSTPPPQLTLQQQAGPAAIEAASVPHPMPRSMPPGQSLG
ncbi:type IV secretion system protein [Paracraurococcus lichenis]|uniref:Type IV secretion system protein n=1 Tax=Paracraurococcus lichenis TaxID=3064888 RepID=A0ABT9E759_9PROT|nr:type IV secretion system protein [Paracraurococcus sp. LOR1-02]MDO9711780.1 type IV secretion system protein [Paracraurococcus sp. LOR1-02]